MNYGPHEFSRLVDEIEAQGGTHLDLLHERRRLTIPIQAKGNKKARASKDLVTTGCDDAALFSIPYKKGVFAGDPESDQQIHIGETERSYVGGELKEKPIPAHMAMEVDEEEDSIVVCAIDDGVGLWPRFEGTWEEEDDE